jgi:hypothetical protein
MSLWFRFYESTLDDPKVQKLKPELFKAWVNLLALASRHEGALPSVADCAFALRVSEDKAGSWLWDLNAAGLMDKTATGYAPHNWASRQFISDGSKERVRRYRDKRRAAGLPLLGDYSRFRSELTARDGERCVYCEATTNLVVDHMVPIALGGTDAIDNLALACRPCNSGKAGRTPELANMRVMVTSAAQALERYRDSSCSDTVTLAPSESESETETDKAADKPAPDLMTLVFTKGVEYLQASTGRSEGSCRSVIGKWRKSTTDEALIKLLGDAQRQGIVEPVSWIEGAINQKPKAGAPARFNG